MSPLSSFVSEWLSIVAILGGQAFLDHVQLTVGAMPGALTQVEVPVVGGRRAELLAALQGASVRDVGRTYGRNLVVIFCVAGPAVAALVVASRLGSLLLGGAVLLGLAALPTRIGLAALLGLATIGAAVALGRWIQRGLG